jgi:hypothetical protein
MDFLPVTVMTGSVSQDVFVIHDAFSSGYAARDACGINIRAN